jgi:sortase (surface protein transpeptidase)
LPNRELPDEVAGADWVVVGREAPTPPPPVRPVAVPPRIIPAVDPPVSLAATPPAAAATPPAPVFPPTAMIPPSTALAAPGVAAVTAPVPVSPESPTAPIAPFAPAGPIAQVAQAAPAAHVASGVTAATLAARAPTPPAREAHSAVPTAPVAYPSEVLRVRHRAARRRGVPPIVTVVVLLIVVVAPVVVFNVLNAWARGAMASAVEDGCTIPTYVERSELGGGACLGVLRIPSLGADWAVPIRNGNSPFSPGATWVEGTSQPGEIGNFAVMGRRVSGGQPFRDVVDLMVGDQVIVETVTHRFTYVVDVAPSDLTVTDRDSWVIDPVPGAVELAPQTAVMTLIMRQDLFPTSDRSVAFAVLRDVEEK